MDTKKLVVIKQDQLDNAICRYCHSHVWMDIGTEIQNEFYEEILNLYNQMIEEGKDVTSLNEAFNICLHCLFNNKNS